MINSVTADGKIGRRWLSCYCEFCQSEKWLDESTAKRAAGCKNIRTVGQWKLFPMKSTGVSSYTHLHDPSPLTIFHLPFPDSSSHQLNLKKYRQRGLMWCVKASSDIHGVTVDTGSLSPTTPLVSFGANEDDCGFSFWLGRLTEPLTRCENGFTGVDGSRFKKGDQHVCLQHLERTPPDSPNVFTLSKTETYVHTHSVFTCTILPKTRMGNTVMLSDSEVMDIQNKLQEF